MKVAIPVAEDRGLDSEIYGHFGSAPVFVLVDSETMSVQALGNAEGTCGGHAEGGGCDHSHAH